MPTTLDCDLPLLLGSKLVFADKRLNCSVEFAKNSNFTPRFNATQCVVESFNLKHKLKKKLAKFRHSEASN